MKPFSRIKVLALLAPLIMAAAVLLSGYHLQGQVGTPSPGQNEGGRGLAFRPSPRPDFTVTVDTDRGVYYVGDSVEVRFRASDDCWVYIFNTDSEGVTRQIFPNYYDRDNALEGNRRYAIPVGRFRLVTTGPAGSESLRIIAYRRLWRALDPWNEFSAGEPFPRRSVAPNDMRGRVESEARAAQEQDSKNAQGGGREGLGLIPVPRDRYYYVYAEDTARFRVQSRRYYLDSWYDPPPQMLR